MVKSSYQCHKCGVKFLTTDDLKRHAISAHKRYKGKDYDALGQIAKIGVTQNV